MHCRLLSNITCFCFLDANNASSYPKLWQTVSVVVIMSDFMWPHGRHCARLLHPPLSPGVCLNTCPLNWWCYLAISSSVFPFSSCPQPFPALGSFSVSWFFASGGQSMGASASASIYPMNIQGLLPLGLTGLISWQSKTVSNITLDARSSLVEDSWSICISWECILLTILNVHKVNGLL